MSSPLLTLGPFSFEGLESPELIQLKAKQRLAVHHLGSGSSITDSLGQDFETASFRGIFAGSNAATRIRSIEYLRLLGEPLPLTWGSTTLFVIIQEFELTYSSNQWVPYKLSCYVMRSRDAQVLTARDLAFASPDSQTGDILDLLQDVDLIPTSAQIAALVELAALNYDTAPLDALQQAMELLGSLDNQIASPSFAQNTNGLSILKSYGDIVADMGQQAILGLARNRLINITVSAECVNQQ
jgi:hypothetical protein